MKRWLPLLLIAIIVVGMAFVIHPKSEEKPTDLVPVSSLVPGVYRAEFAEPDELGWTPFVVMEINGLGEIAEVTFDYSSPEGKLKTQDQEYNMRMKAVSGLGPSRSLRDGSCGRLNHYN
jgi:major membrane immunogen (membrane-anchored lipoprotein)